MSICLVVFYHPDCDFLFLDYGIEIPVVGDRASTVFKNFQTLNPNISHADLSLLPKISKEDLVLVHNQDFVDRLYGTYLELEREMMTCYELVDSNGKYHRYDPKNSKKDFNNAFAVILRQASMTYFSTKHALLHGFSYFLGGGMHHAMSFSGRGFCLINDIVITIRKLQKENIIKTAWVIDVDAHKGDGTAELTVKDASIVTLSIHMKEGWPMDSGSVLDPWFIASDIDVGIARGEEDQYLIQLKAALNKLDQNFPRPDVAIIVNGADPYEHDELASTDKLQLTREQLLARDVLVYEFLKERKIPQSYLMAGGYGKRSWEIYSQFLKFVWESSSKRSEVSSR